MNNELLKIESLKKYFPVKEGFFNKTSNWVKAVDGVDLTINKGEALGIVGESGCGKSTLVDTVLNLTEPTEGKAIFDGKELYSLNKRELRELRKYIQIVFQDPFWSLNPRMLIKDIVGEPMKVHLKLNTTNRVEKVGDILERVGLDRKSIYMYPHEFSGGERQRIAIARALALNPKLVVLDEPTSAIDAMSQSLILSLLEDLKEEMDLTYILISHDLSVVNRMADKIAVMYLGKIVEYGDSKKIFEQPKHPYTKALFAAIPKKEVIGLGSISIIEGNVPSAMNLPSGCRFHTRCPVKLDICSKEAPEYKEIEKGRFCSCHLVN